MITGDYQLMFEDTTTTPSTFITLGGDADYCAVRFDGIGSAELRASERDLSNEDGIAFGREFLGKRMWTINGAIKNGSVNMPATPTSAWDALSKIMRAWDYNKARLAGAREVMPLYMKRPGRETVLVYGRPERIDPDVSQSYAGYVSYQASFRQSDPKFYADTTQVLNLTINQSDVMGILLVDLPGDTLGTMTNAFDNPIVTVGTTSRSGAIVQGGDVPSSPVITITAGAQTLLNPTLKLNGPTTATLWEFTLQTTIAAGASVTIDPRPWQRTVLRNDGASLAGFMRGSRMAEMLVPPGNNEFIYTGSSVGDASTCSITLRNAWAGV